MMKMMREGQLDFDVTGLVCFCVYQIYPTCTIADIMTKGVILRVFQFMTSTLDKRSLLSY